MASLDRPFKDSYGQLDAFQTIAVHSSTQQTMATASHVCYHFLRLFSDVRLPLQIALVQILSFNPPVLLLKPFKQHNKQQYDWGGAVQVYYRQWRAVWMVCKCEYCQCLLSMPN